jgi:phosphatidylglycerol lysyltransferase
MAPQKTLQMARAALPQGQPQRLMIKAGLSVAMAGLFLWMLAHRLGEIDIALIRTTLVSVAPLHWAAACLATVCSFWAVGHYDAVIHRYSGTGTDTNAARRAGATAIAVSQTLGLGVISGAIVRWRMLPDLTLWQSTKLTTLVAAFFVCAWAVVTAFVLLILPAAPFKPIAGGVLLAATAGAITCAVAPLWRAIRWPNMFVLFRLIMMAAIDMVMAAFALWFLLPPDLALPLTTLLPAFLIAFGAGLVSSTPGGVGAFEITLLALLPDLPQTPLLAAVLGWRLVYFAAPSLIGAVCAIRGPELTLRPEPAPLTITPACHSRRAEVGLLAQGHLTLMQAGRNQSWLSGRTAHCLIGLLDPITANGPDEKLAITALIDRAASENRIPTLYKCSARTAVAARQLGLKLVPIAREAWLDPRIFSTSTPSRAGLRRKLRRANAAKITPSCGPHDWRQLVQIAADWASCHGGERGFSMGRFSPTYLASQRVYVALQAGKPIAFASFHTSATEWTLDLMRHAPGIPDGTMQTLIMQAIADAAAQNLPRLSLAAVPIPALIPNPGSGPQAWTYRLIGGCQTGLVQFKSAFVPHWQTLYLAAPHGPGLVLAAAEIARAVHFPGPLPHRPHDDHAQYEFATAP